MEHEGFVDEAAVMALLRGPQSVRSHPHPEDLILSVDDMDFAGWQVSASTPFRGGEFPPQVIDATVRRASPPQIDEPGIGTPHRGSHRWWLAGLAGAFSTMLFSVLLLSLTSRASMELKRPLSPAALVSAKASQAQKPEPATAPPQLTVVSSAPAR